MDSVKITKAPDGGVIEAIVSKSAAHRLLIAGFLSGIDLTEYCEGLSRDITVTKECLKQMGSGARAKGCSLHCGESGSTLRFLIPLAGALNIESDFVCEGRLAQRPMDQFIDCLAQHGCKVEGENPKHLSGKLSSGTFKLPGGISSQYVTGLLFALPLLEEDSLIVVEGRLQSRPYINLTLQVLEKAGIRVKETDYEDRCEFKVPGSQKYELDKSELQNIEGDWSNAAFWIVMDAMFKLQGEDGKGISFRGLNPVSVQGDKMIVPIVDTMLTEKEGSKDRTIDIDVSDIPDLAPAISALACSRPKGSITNIVGAERLRYKESDRLHAITEVLAGLGADIKEARDSLRICSKGYLEGGQADSFGDHRIAMMAAVAATISKEPVTINGATAVNKSYPHFFEDYTKLGGEIQWL